MESDCTNEQNNSRILGNPVFIVFGKKAMKTNKLWKTAAETNHKILESLEFISIIIN